MSDADTQPPASPPATPAVPATAAAPVPPASDDTPGAFGTPLTVSGHPNPHGLPEIAIERPEVAVGAAFAGGLLMGLILKRLAR